MDAAGVGGWRWFGRLVSSMWRSGCGSYPRCCGRALNVPLHWKRLHQPRQLDRFRLPPVQDRLHHVRRLQRQVQPPADIGAIDALGGGEQADRPVPPFLRHSPPPERPCERLHQRWVTPHLGCAADRPGLDGMPVPVQECDLLLSLAPARLCAPELLDQLWVVGFIRLPSTGSISFRGHAGGQGQCGERPRQNRPWKPCATDGALTGVEGTRSGPLRAEPRRVPRVRASGPPAGQALPPSTCSTWPVTQPA